MAVKHENKIRRLAEWIHQAEKIYVLSGAGLSVNSGLPDFRTIKDMDMNKWVG